MKVDKVQKIGNYLVYMFAHIDHLLNFHFTKNFRGLKFKRFLASKKKITRLCKEIASGLTYFGSIRRLE